MFYFLSNKAQFQYLWQLGEHNGHASIFFRLAGLNLQASEFNIQRLSWGL